MAKTQRKGISDLKSAGFKLFGIFGYPLSHTLSPVMQEAGFEKIGLKAYYLALELSPDSFHKACREFKRSALDGFNITVPYKQAVMPHLDQILPEAKAIGAVNTVFRKNGRLIGTNTDVHGFLTSLKTEGRFNPKGKTALVFGAGGAARAVLFGLASSGTKTVFISNRHPGRAEKLVKEFRKRFPRASFEAVRPAHLKKDLAQADLVVNATSLGLKASDTAVVNDGLIPKAKSKKKLFFDLIYHRQETSFLKAAKRKGHKTLGGLGMLLFQGAKAFELWTGQKAPAPVMREALVAGLKGR